MIKVHLLAGFIFIISMFSLAAEISQIPEAQHLVEKAMDALEEENFMLSLELFKEASAFDLENKNILGFIDSLTRMVRLNNYESDQETIDKFLEQKEIERTEKESQQDFNEGEDFISREKNKELARLDRPLGGVEIHFPLIYSSNGDWNTDDFLGKSGDAFKGLGYNITYYPDLFNRIIGLEGRYESYSLFKSEELNLYDEARIGVVLKNYFNEQPQTYSLLGTKISAGLVFGENIDQQTRQMFSSWQFEVYFRDPLLYRLIETDFFAAMGFEGKFQFSLLEETYMLGFGGGIDFTLGDFVLTTLVLHRSLMVKEELQSSWKASLGVKYYFR